jgi:hypothetical protein
VGGGLISCPKPDACLWLPTPILPKCLKPEARMFKHLLIATLLSVGSVAPALADYINLKSDEIGNWTVHTQQDTTLPKKPMQCVAMSKASVGRVSVAITSVLPPNPVDPDVGQGAIMSLSSPEWTFGPESTVSVYFLEKVWTPYTFERKSDHEVSAMGLYESNLSDLALGILNDKQPTSVRLASGKEFPMPLGDAEVLFAYGDCQRRIGDAATGFVPPK